MSTKLMALFVGIGASLAFIAGSMQGCGGSSGSSNQEVCNKVCDKLLACNPDAGAIGQEAYDQCKASCASGSQQHCSNEAAIKSKIESCVAMDCTAAQTCAQTVPACQVTTGAGGTTGSGGSTGTGGSGGGGSGSGWTCYETAADGCSCVASPGGPQGTCTATYTCCFTWASGTTQACSCVNAAAADCTLGINQLSGTKVGDCPP